ncbi:MFS transporter (plasmid) [Pseudonocardia sp. EC080610-09]|uniref:MFS transporter n=1 Tax=unclassified Pseudonocardia TaxID=2619320 RepID=UPI000706222F|nr:MULTISPECIES: MFS transporter [unclassified Pseudonocardia]ALL79463.1 MFS transporter [Pseudonocardia sp. EC080610-09]ALL85584.1 MFS transporter [Pseudonocardia sp. EC080619-01]
MSVDTGTRHPHARRASLAAFVGTVLEWYDFIIYGIAAAIVFNVLFFPTGAPILGTLGALGTFAVGFLARPLGGIVLGRFGDRHGRRSVLVITLVLMGLSTTAIGLLPTYEQAGIIAPILLVLMRLVQGFGAGAEYAGAVVLSVEHADPRRRGLAGTAAPLGFAVATILGNAVFGLFLLLPREEFLAWGWRVPFLLGAVCLLVGYLVRRGVEEPAEFEQVRGSAPCRAGVLASFRAQPRSFLTVVMARIGESAFAYLLPVFGVAYVATTLGLGSSVALTAMLVASAVQALMLPLCGLAADRYGRKTVYLTGTLLSIAWMAPFFLLTETGAFGAVIAAFVVGVGVVYPMMQSAQATWFAELFDAEFRMSGFAIAREAGTIVGGGLAPLAATALFAWSGQWWLVVVLMVVLLSVTVCGLLLGRETLVNTGRDRDAVDVPATP